VGLLDSVVDTLNVSDGVLLLDGVGGGVTVVLKLSVELLLPVVERDWDNETV
jgi:hypothetical protein